MFYIKIRNNLNNKKFYWISKNWIKRKPIFLFWKFIYKGDYGLEKNKNSFNLLKKTLWQFIGVTVYSIIIIFLFELYNYILPLGQNYDSQAVDTFLSAVASISGVFLGLYFTAISGIASNFLIRASQDIREYFFSAPEGKQYIKTVAITGIVSIFYIVLKSFNHTIHPVGIAFLSLLASYIIIRFWSVGSNVFHFLEPSKSFSFITKDITDSIKKVIPNRYQWDKDFFQNHHKNVVDYRLKLMGNIIRFGNEEMKMPDEELIYAVKYLLGLLHYYSTEKGKIPTASLWFKTKVQYTNWSIASSTEMSLAMHTGTNLQPKSIKNYTWFEEDCLDIIYNIFKYLADKDDNSFFFKAYENLVYSPEIYAKHFDVVSLKLFLKTIEKINKLLALKNITSEKESVFKEQIAYIDMQGMVGISAVLGLTKYLKNNNCSHLVKSLSKIDWINKSKDIYLSDMPLAIIDRLESISKELKNEIKIEGKIYSKDWYITTLCVQKYLFSLQEYFKYLKTLNKNYFEKKYNKFLKDKNIPLAVQLNQRWLEYVNKYKDLMYYFKKTVEDCNKKQELKDLPWPIIDIENEIKEAKKISDEIEDKIILLLPTLEKLKTGKDLPDYFGQALQIGLEACYFACKENNSKRFKKIMPLVFVSSISAHQMTREEVKDWNQEESKIIFATEPLENLFELSGYSKLYSELFDNLEIWNITETLWEAYLKTVNILDVIKYFSAIFNYRDSVFKIMPQASLRSQWKIDFENELRKRGFSIFPDSRSSFHRDEPIKHKSAIIRAIARLRGLMLSGGRDLFMAVYLSNKPEAKDVDLPDRHNFKEYIQREENSNEEIENYD